LIILKKLYFFQKNSCFFFLFACDSFMNEHIGFDSREKWISILNLLVVASSIIFFNSRLPFSHTLCSFVSHRCSCHLYCFESIFKEDRQYFAFDLIIFLLE
jgi:hypothetical protein